jgi:hypothetical protein
LNQLSNWTSNAPVGISARHAPAGKKNYPVQDRANVLASNKWNSKLIYQIVE